MTRALALILALSVAPASAAVLCPPPQVIVNQHDKPPPDKERCIGESAKAGTVKANIRKRMPGK